MGGLERRIGPPPPPPPGLMGGLGPGLPPSPAFTGLVAAGRCAPSSASDTSPFLSGLRSAVRIGRLDPAPRAGMPAEAGGAAAAGVVKRPGPVTCIEYQMEGYCPE